MTWLGRLLGRTAPSGAAAGASDSCRSCRHFDNAPASLEQAFGNLAAMSSGYASVRAEDGVCRLRGIYLSAGASCSAFAT